MVNFLIKEKSVKLKQSNYKQAPMAKKEEKILECCGVTRIDDYFWLKDKSNPEVIAYLEAENKYTDEVMASTKELQQSIYDEIVGRIKEDDESYPYADNGYFYFSRVEKGKQYTTYLRKKGSVDKAEEVIFDVNKMAEGESAFIFQGYSISPNNKLAAYLYNTTGSYAEFTLKIRDLESGKDLDFAVDGVASFTWANDSKTLFFSKIDHTLRPIEVYRQQITAENAELVYAEEDEKFGVYVGGDNKDKNKKYIYIASVSSTTTEIRYLSADEPQADFTVFMPRKHKTEYEITSYDDSFIVKYKDEDNLNSKVYLAPMVTHSDRSTWQELVAHNDAIFIEDILVLSDYLITETRENGLQHINIIGLKDKNYQQTIKFPEVAYSAELSVNREFKTTKIRYTYSSLKRPATLYEYDIVSGETKTLKVQEIPSGFEPDDYVVERLMATANDGTKVPMNVLYKKDLVKDGSNPALLYAYGSYGINISSGFSHNIFSLVDRGYVYAMAEIRGSSQLGEQWYQDGKLLKKKNTFTDFIACAEHLIAENYTNSEKLAIMGGSAGGLLMGAVSNMRPDLFNCVLAIVPFVDVVTTMLDDSLPLTTGEYEEWGNPNEKEYFDYMLSYSPYDNIEAKNYPNILVTGGINDSQVLYHEPAKYTAKLRDLKTDDNILLLHMDMKSGHGGATGRYDRIKDVAFEYAFILKFTK